MGSKGKVKRAPGDRYLAIPYHILNLRGIGLCRKVLLAHIYSFGEKGCYQSNKTLADIFMVSPKSIRRWIADIKTHLYIKNPKGYYRTMWAKTHPKVQTTKDNQRIPDKACPVHLPKSDQRVGQKGAGELVKSGLSPGQKCPTTNNNTNKETNSKTTAPLSLLPAGGQAPAVLTERQRQMVAEIKKFKDAFGIGRKRGERLSEQQFEQRRQQMRKALLAG